jgi:hypothetical protein
MDMSPTPIWDLWQAGGPYIGTNRANVRITADPDWMLQVDYSANHRGRGTWWRDEGGDALSDFARISSWMIDSRKRRGDRFFQQVRDGEWSYWGTGATSTPITPPGPGTTRVELAVFLKTEADSQVTGNPDLQALPAYDGIPDYPDLTGLSGAEISAIGQITQANIMAGFPDGYFKPTVEATESQQDAAVIRLQQYLTGTTATNAARAVMEVPNVQSIQWDKSIDTDAAECTITISNIAMKANLDIAYDESELGFPGFYNPLYGESTDERARWPNHVPNNWARVLYPNVILRSYEGAGGTDLTVKEAVDAWLIDRVSLGTSGQLTITARDMARLLIEQFALPPLVPESSYPLRYVRYINLESGEQRSGNYFDYADIVYDMLLWAGFLYSVFPYEQLPDLGGGPPPEPAEAGFSQVHGVIERTGAYADEGLPDDLFDQRPLIDIITEIRGIVGYIFYIDEQGGAHFHCVDEETEILTDRGWLKHSEIQIGDQALALDKEQRVSTWTPIDNVCRYSVTDTTMLSMESRSHSSLTTMNHRWWTEDARVTSPRRLPGWRTSETLTADDAIPVAVPYNDCPAVRTYSDDFVALIGWWITEGHQMSPRCGNIVQSHVANGPHVETIRGLLSGLYGSPGRMCPGGQRISNETILEAKDLIDAGVLQSDVARKLGISRHTIADWRRRGFPQWSRWNEKRFTDRRTTFALGDSIMDAIYAVAPDRVPSMEFVRCLTRDQLEILIRHSLNGDGSETHVARGDAKWGPYDRYHQPNEEQAKIFEIICALSGRATHTIAEPRANAFRTNILKSTRIKPVGAAGNRNGAAQTEKVQYSGVVWCPQLADHHVWLARRNGTVFYTGNSPNWWEPGNFDEDQNHVDYVPAIDEKVQLTEYTMSLSSENLRTQIVIGSTAIPPVPPYGSSAQTYAAYNDAVGRATFYEPPEAQELAHGMVLPALWTNQAFNDPDEQLLMAQLIALHIHYRGRQGSVTMVGNPAISMNDQVRIYERNTGETNIHYVRGINSNLDNVTGVHLMTLTTNWLGDGDDWPISNSANLRIAMIKDAT